MKPVNLKNIGPLNIGPLNIGLLILITMFSCSCSQWNRNHSGDDIRLNFNYPKDSGTDLSMDSVAYSTGEWYGDDEGTGSIYYETIQPIKITTDKFQNERPRRKQFAVGTTNFKLRQVTFYCSEHTLDSLRLEDFGKVVDVGLPNWLIVPENTGHNRRGLNRPAPLNTYILFVDIDYNFMDVVTFLRGTEDAFAATVETVELFDSRTNP